ncbi:hypothetical protein THAOC_20168 [Thalassiosira oceanica]|uniref:Uncharacterized protein n=1 Tax=Thalassiosira oceanica TaxID=159749 RepID=K0S2X7_THAOC|nr:hypothetical protein THAOC_20168 [Thalassiosira oceanica]|eukprot:EJK59585.1 hypothetical protein THAOC_20168 [Thalassiosira oceanica]
MNALSDSNHTCLLVGLSEDFDLDAINLESGSNGLYMNRMFKIHKLMTEWYRNGGGNVPHLNMEMTGEDSVLLAPFLMESVVRRHDAFRVAAVPGAPSSGQHQKAPHGSVGAGRGHRPPCDRRQRPRLGA